MRAFLERLSAWPAYRWVCVMLVAYFAIALSGTWINFLELHLNAIGTYDLAVNQQSLSSTIHGGKPFPFYEATNCGRNDRCSYLLVHPVLLAYPVAGAYSLAQSPFTLFTLQDAALALAALPLFAIARKLMGSERWALVAAGVYLAWMPAFSGIFSFHWEAFIPLEIFTIFWLWLTGRFALALPVVVVAYVTLEITPVLLFFIAVFFLIPYIGPAWRVVRPRPRSDPTPDGPKPAGARDKLRRFASALQKDRMVRASVALLVGSVAAYILLHEFVRQGGWLLGLPPLPAKYHLSLTQPVYAANFTLGNLVTAWPRKLVFWLVMFGTLAMIPFLAPRTLVISAPWIAFTLLTSASFYRMGNQYSFIGASVLMIGFVYGLARLKIWMERPVGGSFDERVGPSPGVDPTRGTDDRGPWGEGETSPPVGAGASAEADSERWTETGPAPEAVSSRSAQSEPGRAGQPRVRGTSRSLRDRRRLAVVGTVVIGILVFNLFLNPLNPWAAPLKTDQPFAEQASLGLRPSINTTGYQQLHKVIAIMSPNAVVAVSPELFPLVANDRFAYPLLANMNDSYLPFNVTVGTQYVLFSEHGGHLTPYLSLYLYNPSDFGVRAWITSTYVGPILLFERGYTGPIEIFGPIPGFADVTYTPTSGLVPGTVGALTKAPQSTSGYVIGTTFEKISHHPYHVRTGDVFHTQAFNIVPGTYRVTVIITGHYTGAKRHPMANATVVVIAAHATADPIATIALNYSWFPPTGWTVLSFIITVPSPAFAFKITGSSHEYWFAFSVEEVTVSAVNGS